MSTSLPEYLAEWLDTAHKESAVPKTRIVERAVEAYLSEHHPPKLPKTPRTTHGNVDPTNRDVLETLKRDRAGHPLFTKDLRPYHQQPSHLFAEKEVTTDE